MGRPGRPLLTKRAGVPGDQTPFSLCRRDKHLLRTAKSLPLLEKTRNDTCLV